MDRVFAGIPFIVVAVLVPLAALFLERAGNVRIAERHHSHHDTYAVPVPFTRSLTYAMLFMGILGVTLFWLCCEGELAADPVVVACFFDAFLITMFLLWWDLCRYKVSVFNDCMVVTPLYGADVWVRFDQIERLERRGRGEGLGFSALDVYVGGERTVRIFGIVDLEQILMRIDRFDVLAHEEH